MHNQQNKIENIVKLHFDIVPNKIRERKHPYQLNCIRDDQRNPRLPINGTSESGSKAAKTASQGIHHHISTTHLQGVQKSTRPSTRKS